MKKKLIKIILINLVCFFFIFTNFIIYNNLHFHILENGHLIFHGHPFNKSNTCNSPINSHCHSSFEFLLYSLSTNVKAIIIFLSAIIIIRKLIVVSVDCFYQFVYINPAFLVPADRAPPSDRF